MLGLLGELDGDQWAVQSLCPDWTVQGVVGHLGGVEAMMTGWRPEAEKPPPFAEVGTFVSEAAVLDPTALLARFTEVLDARSADMANVDDELLAAPSFTPVGVQTYGRFLAIRVFDFWVHEQDLRGPLGIAGNESGPAAEMALDEVIRSFGYIAGKKVGVPKGHGVTVHLTGGVTTDFSAYVEERAAVVDSLARPDAEITLDFVTFMQLACGRIDPDRVVAEGRVQRSGDSELADRLARNLAFTM